jgi:hypothetical protein
MQRKSKLRLSSQTLRILTGPALEHARGGGLPTIMTTISDNPPPPPPHTNSISPCCASLHQVCPAE